MGSAVFHPPLDASKSTISVKLDSLDFVHFLVGLVNNLSKFGELGLGVTFMEAVDLSYSIVYLNLWVIWRSIM
jgi:hypothetical protein